MGCSVAREAALDGAEVLVLEAGSAETAEGGPAATPGAASGAAGGMLSPLGEAPEPGPFLRLATRSLEMYPAFVSSLEEETGVPIELRRAGKLLLALDEAQEERLRRRMGWQAAKGHDVEWIAPHEVRDMEPAASAEVRGALHLRGEGSVDNRRLLEALQAAVEAAGGRLRSGASVEEILHERGRTTGVRLVGGERVAAERVVIAAGAWSARLGGLPRKLPVRPVRGQMVAVAADDRIRRTVSSGEVYLVPRGEGTSLPGVWIGATQEEAGFEAVTTASGVRELLDGAVRAVPSLGEAPLVGRWAGLRPGTPDDRPVIGPDPEVEGLLYATGHFRNGILLAPLTGAIVGALCLDRAPGLELEPFAPDRFERR